MITSGGTIAGPGLELGDRVMSLETSFEALQSSIERVETEAREGQARLERKLDDQTVLLGTKLDAMGVRQAASQRTNWSVIGTWLSIGVSLAVAIGAAVLLPLQQADKYHERELDRQHELGMRTFEMSIRTDEQMKALRSGKP